MCAGAPQLDFVAAAAVSAAGRLPGPPLAAVVTGLSSPSSSPQRGRGRGLGQCQRRTQSSPRASLRETPRSRTIRARAAPPGWELRPESLSPSSFSLFCTDLPRHGLLCCCWQSVVLRRTLPAQFRPLASLGPAPGTKSDLTFSDSPRGLLRRGPSVRVRPRRPRHRRPPSAAAPSQWRSSGRRDSVDFLTM